MVDEVAVGEEHRRLGFLRLDARGVGREHVGPVEEIGDAAKAFGLALGAPVAARPVKPHQLGVGGGIDLGDEREREGLRRHAADFEAVGLRVVAVGRQRHSVECDRDEGEFVAGEDEVPSAPASGRRASRAVTFVFDEAKVEVEIDCVDAVGGRRVVAQADGERL